MADINTEPKKKKFSKEDMVNYFREMKSDFRKVVWPTPKAVAKNSMLVIVALVVSGALITLIDLGFVKLANLFIK